MHQTNSPATPWLFLAPAILIYTAFLVGPMLFTLYTSFFDWDGLSDTMAFVGLRNYIDIVFNDDMSRLALWNTLLWTLGSVTVPTSIGLLLAVALNQATVINKTLRTLYYLPAVLPLVSVGLIWGWLYNPHFGAINTGLRAIGLDQLAGGWLSSFEMALPATFITFVWSQVGFPMMLYLAGLQSIPTEQYEAARIDGAGRFAQFRYITLPGLAETHVIVISLSVFNAFRVFDLIYTMTYGGPGGSTHVLGTWMYFQTFQYYEAGYGAAIAWLMAIMVLLVAVPYIRRMSRD